MKPEVRELAERSVKGCSGGGAFQRGHCLACLPRTGKVDRRGSFTFNRASGWYQCFKCGLVGRMPGYESVDMPVPRTGLSPLIQPPQGFLELCRGEGLGAVCLEPAREYLRSRGLADETVWREARLGACLEGTFRGRVVVPVLSPDGDWLGHVGRRCGPDESADAAERLGGRPSPKYLYPRGMRRGEVLYNHAALLAQTDEPLLVVEGAPDALALWPDGAGVLGKPSEWQVLALADCGRPVAVVLDGDAWEEGRELAMRLEMEGQRAGYVRLPPKMDPDEVPGDWLREEARRSVERG